MTDSRVDPDDLDDAGENPPGSDRTNSEWAQLRKAEKAKADAEKAAAESNKALAFMRAGIDPESEAAKYFYKGYDGEVTKEAIVAEATKIGLLSPTAAPAPDPTATQAAQQAGAISGASDGATPPDGMPQDQQLQAIYQEAGGPFGEGDKAIEAALREAGYPVQYSR